MLELVERRLVLELRQPEREREPRVGDVGRVDLDELAGEVHALPVAPADERELSHRRDPAQVRAHGEVRREGGAVGLVVGRQGSVACGLAGLADARLLLREEVVARAYAGQLVGGAHADCVEAVGVEREGLVEQAPSLRYELLRVFGVGEGELVVDGVRRERDEVEGAVGVGLRQRIAVGREALAEPGERLHGAQRLFFVQLTNKPQAKALIILFARVVRHARPLESGPSRRPIRQRACN